MGIFKKTLASALAVFMLAFSAIGCFSAIAKSDEDIQLEESLLGTVSAKYESNGDPATISSGNGDPGGASYGAYQFSGRYQVPYTFAQWCVSSGKGTDTGNRLIAAYQDDGNAFSVNFVAAWKSIASENASAFLKLQHDYIKSAYYDALVSGLRNNLNFDVDNYGIALKNAVWSRAVQHGVGSFASGSGAAGLFKTIDGSLSGGLSGASEPDIITALYREAGRTVDGGDNPMYAANAGSNGSIISQYGLEGKTLSHYSGSSAAVQASVWLRLNVNELNDLLAMYQQYGGSHAVLRQAWIISLSTGVNIRQEPSTDSAVLKMVPKGTPVTVTGNLSGSWYPVSLTYAGETYSGYCYCDYITFTDPAANADRPGKIANASTVVNIRSQATTDSAVLVSVPVGTELVVHGGLSGGWYSVTLTYNGTTYNGYCYGQYVAVEPVTPDNPVEPAGTGDVNMDGKIDATDALLVLQCAVGKGDFTEAQLAVADVNGDGARDATDALMILQFAVNKISSFS